MKRRAFPDLAAPHPGCKFYPDVDEVLGQLFGAALQRLIVSESVKSLTQSSWSGLSRIVAWSTRRAHEQ